MIGAARIGGLRRRHRRQPALAHHADLATAQLSHLTRLEHDLQRACARYERAIAVLDEESTELERRARTEALVEAAMNDGPKEPRKRGKGRIRLTEATFDDLRGIGLSITQSKRILALRDEGLLTSTGGLSEVPGLPSVVAMELQQQLRD